jgi:ribosome-binding protein aMBF1 (putative translation factor)
MKNRSTDDSKPLGGAGGGPVADGRAMVAQRQDVARALHLLKKDQARAREKRELARLIDNLVAKRVRERRIASGMTQQHLAERVGVAPQQVHRYECGESRITAGRLSQIAEALGFSVDDFFTPNRATARRGAGKRGSRGKEVG